MNLLTMLIAIAIMLPYTKGDISDDECGVYVEKAIAIPQSSIDNLLEKIKPNSEYRKKPKKSLLIVFDGTGSMGNDLAEMKRAAVKITNQLSSREDNPIKNYVLVVFRDPDVEQALSTDDPNALLAKLNAVIVGGGGDCPEKAITGIKLALEHALPKSLVYVFTDAAATDHHLYESILPIIQEKQVKITFLKTGGCYNIPPSHPSVEVYQKLAEVSDGLVLELSRDSVEKILLEMSKELDPKFQKIQSYKSTTGAVSNTPVKVDQSFSKVTVTVSGSNPMLSIKDNKNEAIKNPEIFSSKNVKFITFSASGSVYTIEASADSGYSVQVGGISELEFEFGFSTDLPSSKSETSVQPLIGHKNVLSVFVSDAKFVKCLTHVVLQPVASNGFSDIKIGFERIKGTMYSTELIDIPVKSFKIKIFGYDKSGNQIERLISSSVESVKGLPPKVIFESSGLVVNQNGSLKLNCKISSLTPAKTSIYFNGRLMKFQSTNQSAEVVMTIEPFETENVGNYKCEVENSLGKVDTEVLIAIKLAPIVNIFPESLKLKIGQKASIECSARNLQGAAKFEWIDDSGTTTKAVGNDGVENFQSLIQKFSFLSTKNGQKYEFIASNRHDQRKISCTVENEDFIITKSCLIEVEYSPDFKSGNNGQTITRNILHGNTFYITCESFENPKATIKWFRGSSKQSLKQIDFKPRKYNFESMNSSIQGWYSCLLENSVGKVIKYINVVHTPRGFPKIEGVKVIIAAENDQVELKCSCKKCLPIKSAVWTKPNTKKKYKETSFFDEESDIFTAVLTIEKIEISDDGTYKCSLSNSKGKRDFITRLLVQAKPKDLLISLTGKKHFEVKSTATISDFGNYQLKCIAFAHPVPNVIWHRNGVKINSSQKVSVLDLAEKELASQSGNYECIVKNKLGQNSHKFELKIEIPPKINCNKHQTIVVKENEKVKLNCDISGIPEPEIKWFKDSKLLMSEKNAKFLNGRKILEFKASNENFATYSCLGGNRFGEASVAFQVIIQGPPRIVNSDDENIKLNVGDSLDLTCEATGSPKPSLSWIKDGKQTKFEENVLIPELEAGDEGIYSCVARNLAGTARKNFNITIVQYPRILLEMENVTISSPDPLTVECYADGYPVPEIWWLRENKILGSGPSLEIDKSMTSGWYKCAFENSEGKGESKFYVNFLSPPSILKDYSRHDNQRNAVIGKKLELFCPFENYETIVWKKDGIVLDDKTEGNLTLQRIQEDAAGNYECIASNTMGSGNFTYEFVVWTPAKIVVFNEKTRKNDYEDFHFEDKDIKEGETLVLDCKTVGIPTPYNQWFDPNNTKSVEERLVIENISRTASGTYKCVVENEVSQAVLNYKVRVSSKPRVVDGIHESTIKKFVGNFLELSCIIDGSPRPTMHWFKDDEKIVGRTGSLFSIQELTLDDFGQYKCIGINSHGSVTIEFNVVLIADAKVIQVKENEDKRDDFLTLSCFVSGSPFPKITWSDNKVVLSSTELLDVGEHFSSSPHSFVLIDNRGNEISRTQANLMNHYSQLTVLDDDSLKFDIIFKDKTKAPSKLTCSAENEHNKDSSYIKPNLKDGIRYGDDSDAEVTLLVDLEQELVLKCNIEGLPSPTYRWAYNGREILQDTFEYTLASSKKTLTIINTRKMHENAFSCIGKNTWNSLRIAFEINIQMKSYWSKFTPWTPCSATCGRGFKIRQRICHLADGQRVESKGNCIGEEAESLQCSLPLCVIDGNWSEYSEWTQCSRTCGTGYQYQRRTCDNPAPENGGLDCEGHSERYQYCKIADCLRSPKRINQKRP